MFWPGTAGSGSTGPESIRTAWAWVLEIPNRREPINCNVFWYIIGILSTTISLLTWYELRYVIKIWYLSYRLYKHQRICQNNHSMSFKSIYSRVFLIDSWGKIPSDYQSRQQSWNVWCAVCSLLPSFIATTFLRWPCVLYCFVLYDLCKDVAWIPLNTHIQY